ncbi:hypothetical protein RJT34_04823 [Clitoria ternatea]|uniref:Uncharacterized protein n=1 Tax=Clitoria ternatea TaxID=43366 RepID=A0AAN9KPS0_CLITE
MLLYISLIVEQIHENGIMDFNCFEHVLLSSNACVTGTPLNDKTQGDATWSHFYEENDSQVDLKYLDNATCSQSKEFLSNQPYYLPQSCKWDQKENVLIKLGTDDKQNNNCEALASNALDVDDRGKCSVSDDDTNDFCKGITTQDIGDKGQRVLHVIANDVVVPSNCGEDASSCTESTKSKLKT